MGRKCQQCGRLFVAKRATAKYCSSSCRGQASKDRKAAGGGGTVRRLDTANDEHGSRDSRRIVDAVTRELEEAGRVDTVAGATVLALAVRLDEGSMETGSAYAALVREFRAAMAAAMAGATRAVDPVDELRARRDAKRTG